MRPEVISEVLKADLDVYSVFSLLSAAMGSAFLCDVCHQPAHPPGLLGTPWQGPTHTWPLLPPLRYISTSRIFSSFQHRSAEHGLSSCPQSVAGP